MNKQTRRFLYGGVFLAIGLDSFSIPPQVKELQQILDCSFTEQLGFILPIWLIWYGLHKMGKTTK